MPAATSAKGTAAQGSDPTAALGGTYQMLFQRIYEEVFAEARQIEAALARRGEEIPLFEAVQQRLIDLIERLAGDAPHLPPAHEKRLALYVIVAMADEVFLRAPRLGGWAGRDAWLRMPLEEQIFHSHSSGERVFDMLKDALEYRSPLSLDLLSVFLTALSLGFCGRYPDDSPEPENYRRELAEYLRRDLVKHAGYDASGAGDEGARADAALFQHDAKKVTDRAALASVMNGITPILAVIALWLVAGFGIWQYCTYRLGQVLDAIEAAQ